MITYNVNLRKDKNSESESKIWKSFKNFNINIILIDLLSSELNKTVSILQRVIENFNSTYKINSIQKIENGQINFKLFDE